MRRQDGRGSALLVVLFVVLLCAGALLIAAAQIHWTAGRLIDQRERLAADRLSEAGIARAAAELHRDPGFTGEVEGELDAGRYRATVAAPDAAHLVITSLGTTPGGRAVRLVLEVERGGGGFRVLSRERTRADSR